MVNKPVERLVFDDYKNLTEQQKNDLVRSYEPLIVHMADQFHKKVEESWDNLISAAYEGFAQAINGYKPGSTQTFAQYAAWCMRFNILHSINNEIRTVRIPTHIYRKMKEDNQASGKQSFTSVRIDTGGVNTSNLQVHGSTLNLAQAKVCYDPHFDDGDVLDFLCQKVDEKFPGVESTLFYRKFGLKGYEPVRGNVLAKEYGTSEGWVSQRIHRVIRFIRKNDEICEMLANLVS